MKEKIYKNLTRYFDDSIKDTIDNFVRILNEDENLPRLNLEVGVYISNVGGQQLPYGAISTPYTGTNFNFITTSGRRPWNSLSQEHPPLRMSKDDETGFAWYIEKFYGIYNPSKLSAAIMLVANQNYNGEIDACAKNS